MTSPQRALNFAAITAVSARNVASLEAAVLRGASIHTSDQFGMTLLHRAAENDDVAMIRKLVDLGARINECDISKSSALHHAFHKKSMNAALALITCGINPHLIDSNDRKAIDILEQLEPTVEKIAVRDALLAYMQEDPEAKKLAETMLPQPDDPAIADIRHIKRRTAQRFKM